jgi:hypothetical protein
MSALKRKILLTSPGLRSANVGIVARDVAGVVPSGAVRQVLDHGTSLYNNSPALDMNRI